MENDGKNGKSWKNGKIRKIWNNTLQLNLDYIIKYIIYIFEINKQ